MPSYVIKRSVSIEGHKTSVSLEDEFWEHLRRMARMEDMGISTFIATRIATVDQGNANLSSAIRLYVLRALQEGRRIDAV